MQTAKWKDLATTLRAKRTLAEENLQKAVTMEADAQRGAAAAAEAVELTANVAREIQQKVHTRIASIASRCLAAIFGDEAYELRCRFDLKRNKTEVRFVLFRAGVELDEPQDSCGGGVQDIVAFALRVANLRFRRQPLRQLLVLDEPFKWLDETKRPAVRTMIEELNEELGIQFIIVTHDPEYVIGKVVEVRR